jgi:hypothetical protein
LQAPQEYIDATGILFMRLEEELSKCADEILGDEFP